MHWPACRETQGAPLVLRWPRHAFQCSDSPAYQARRGALGSEGEFPRAPDQEADPSPPGSLSLPPSRLWPASIAGAKWDWDLRHPDSAIELLGELETHCS
eukprot:7210455-Pyramimonas_sp.AAC.1